MIKKTKSFSFPAMKSQHLCGHNHSSGGYFFKKQGFSDRHYLDNQLDVIEKSTVKSLKHKPNNRYLMHLGGREIII